MKSFGWFDYKVHIFLGVSKAVWTQNEWTAARLFVKAGNWAADCAYNTHTRKHNPHPHCTHTHTHTEELNPPIHT